MKPVMLLLVISILLISIASSKISPTLTTEHGLHINTWDIDYIKLNTNHTFVWDVDEFGMLIPANQTNCTFFLYESGNIKTGALVIQNAVITTDNRGWYYTVSDKNLSRLAKYNYQLDCFKKVNTSISGNYLATFEVTPTGIEPTLVRNIAIQFSIASIFFICILFFVAMLVFGHPLAKYGLGTFSIIFFLVGINLIFNSLTNEVVDPNILTLFDFISAASYYFYWLAFGLLAIILFVTSLVKLFENYSKQKLVRYE